MCNEPMHCALLKTWIRLLAPCTPNPSFLTHRHTTSVSYAPYTHTFQHQLLDIVSKINPWCNHLFNASQLTWFTLISRINYLFSHLISINFANSAWHLSLRTLIVTLYAASISFSGAVSNSVLVPLFSPPVPRPLAPSSPLSPFSFHHLHTVPCSESFNRQTLCPPSPLSVSPLSQNLLSLFIWVIQKFRLIYSHWSKSTTYKSLVFWQCYTGN